MSNIIEMLDVTYAYEGNSCSVLENINIRIKKGEIFGLLGPSGAGKTTIIKLLTGQLDSSKQQISVLGQNVNKLDRGFYTKIGLVIDTVGLYERLTCVENLKMMARIHGVYSGYIGEILQKVGLVEAANREVYKLSTGMRQRLLLARALLHSPEILFLDEPTRGLDPVTADEIHELIQSVSNDGTTIFLTTHNMYEAEKLCDNIALLSKGHIVEYGKPQKIKEKYFKDDSVKIVLKNGEEQILHFKKELNEIISIFRSGEVCTIHSQEPTLEEIFIKLTEEGLG